MGCIQSRVEPDNSLNNNHITSKSSEPIVTHGKASTVKSEAVTQRLEPVESIKATDDQRMQSNTSFHMSDNATPHQNIPISPIPIDSKDTSTSRIKSSKSIDMHSNGSDILEVSSLSALSSSRLNQRLSTYEPVISSSPDFRRKIYHKDAINRFLSARPSRPNDHLTPTDNYIWTDSDEYYSLHDSFVSSVSADSEGTLTDRPKISQSKKSNVQRKLVVNELSTESDEFISHHAMEII